MKLVCLMCGVGFEAKRSHGRFCSNICRSKYRREIPVDRTVGTVAGIRKLRNGAVSVTLHFHGPSAERAMKYDHGIRLETVRV